MTFQFFCSSDLSVIAHRMLLVGRGVAREGDLAMTIYIVVVCVAMAYVGDLAMTVYIVVVCVAMAYVGDLTINLPN